MTNNSGIIYVPSIVTYWPPNIAIAELHGPLCGIWSTSNKLNITSIANCYMCAIDRLKLYRTLKIQISVRMYMYMY